MTELVFLKLGGSLLTDKTAPQVLHRSVLARLAGEIAGAIAARDGDLRLVIGHGSGSFGHVTASRWGTREGVRTRDEWQGYADTARDAAALNAYVAEALWFAGVPALRLQPSASALCRDGELVAFNERPLIVGIDQGLVPLIYGDVALDEVRGGTIISTEELFAWLAPLLEPQRVILVGEVEGVLTADPASGVHGEVIKVITPDVLPALGNVLGGSRGVDVTGGMLAKVREMLALVQFAPGLQEVHIVSGLEAGLVQRALSDSHVEAGTRIRARA